MRPSENEYKISTIIQAAQSVFAELGYKKVTMDDVASQLDIARSGLYHYFKNKEELFVAVLEYELALHAKDLESLIGQAVTTEDKIITFGTTFVNSRKKFHNMYKITYGDISMSHDMIRKIKARSLSFQTETIMKILKSDRSLAHIPDLNAVSSLLGMSLSGVVRHSADKNDNHLLNDILNLCRIFYFGLCAMSEK